MAYTGYGFLQLASIRQKLPNNLKLKGIGGYGTVYPRVGEGNPPVPTGLKGKRTQ